MVASIKSVIKVILSTLFLISIENVCFSQTTTPLSKEINKSIGNAFIMLDDSTKKEEKCFFIKMIVDDQSLISNIEISDNIDSLYKRKILNNFNFLNIQSQLKKDNLVSIVVLTPVYISSISSFKISNLELLTINKFKNQNLFGEVYMTPPCKIETKFSQN